MKKIFILALFFLVFVMVYCGGDDSSTEPDLSTTTSQSITTNYSSTVTSNSSNGTNSSTSTAQSTTSSNGSNNPTTSSIPSTDTTSTTTLTTSPAPMGKIIDPDGGCVPVALTSISGTAYDETAITSINLVLDSSIQLSVLGSNNWTSSISAISTAIGYHTLMLTVFDGDGNTCVDVNTFITSEGFGKKSVPYIASNSTGEKPVIAMNSTNSVVVWNNYDSSSPAIHAQLIDINGSLIGSNIYAFNTSGVAAFEPDVCMDDNGYFVIVFHNYDAGPLSIKAGIFDPTGSLSGSMFRVSPTGFLTHSNPCVGINGSGSFTVLWVDESVNDILGRSFNLNGTETVAQFTVCQSNSGTQGCPKIAYNKSNGNYVATWVSNHSGSYQIMYRLFTTEGTALTNDIADASNNIINPVLSDNMLDVSMNVNGNYVIVWQTDSTNSSIYAQRYNSSGSPLGTLISVNSITTGNHTHPSVALDNSDNFIIAWENGSKIYYKKYNSSGTPISTTDAMYESDSLITNYTATDIAVNSDGIFGICNKYYNDNTSVTIFIESANYITCP